MAVTHKLYGTSMKNMLINNITSLSSTDTAVTLSLLTSAHTFTQANEYWATVSANELTTTYTGSTDYAGQVLTGKTITSTGDVSTIFDAADVTFTSTGNIKAYHGVLRASSYLISSINFDGEQESVGGEFSVNWNSSGIFWINVST
jgi:hypothetical protein